MNEIIETLKNEIRATEQILFLELKVLNDINEKIASGITDVISPSRQQQQIAKLEGCILGFQRSIDLINLALIHGETK